MAKEKKPNEPQPKQYNEKLSIKGSFLDVFKVVKKDKERRATEEKKS